MNTEKLIQAIETIPLKELDSVLYGKYPATKAAAIRVWIESRNKVGKENIINNLEKAIKKYGE